MTSLFFFFLGPSGPAKGHKCIVTSNSPDERPIDVACTFGIRGTRSRNKLFEGTQTRGTGILGIDEVPDVGVLRSFRCLESNQFLPRVSLSLRTRSYRSFKRSNLICGLKQAWERKRTVVQLRPRTLVKIISCSTFRRIIDTDLGKDADTRSTIQVPEIGTCDILCTFGATSPALKKFS